MASVKGTAYFIVDESGKAVSELPDSELSVFLNAAAKRVLMGDGDVSLREVMISPRDPAEALAVVNESHGRNLRAVPFLDYLSQNKDNIWLFENLPIPLKLINDQKLMGAMAEIANSSHSYMDKKANLKERFETMTGEKLPESMALTMLKKPREEWFGKVGDWAKDITPRSPVGEVVEAMLSLSEQKQRRGTLNAGFMTHLANNMMRFSQADSPIKETQRMVSMSLLFRRAQGAAITDSLKQHTQSALGLTSVSVRPVLAMDGVDPVSKMDGASTAQLEGHLEEIIHSLSEVSFDERLSGALDIAAMVSDKAIGDVAKLSYALAEKSSPAIDNNSPKQRIQLASQ